MLMRQLTQQQEASFDFMRQARSRLLEFTGASHRREDMDESSADVRRIFLPPISTVVKVKAE
ncbi:hypothetical protein LINPERHAP1_LOCUS9731 [Linum perenne]